MKPKAKCSFEGCEKPVHQTGLCSGHYWQKRRRGHLSPLKEPSGQSRSQAGIDFLIANASATVGDCILWPYYLDRDGYGVLYIDRKLRRANRVMCTLAHGEPPAVDMVAAHRCRSRACVNPGHLRWATALENNDDKAADGTHPKGELNPHAKLTEQQAVAIFLDPRPAKLLAAEYGCRVPAIRKIKRRENWAHVTAGHALPPALKRRRA